MMQKSPRDLGRSNVTMASRVMLPTYVGFFFLIGMFTIFTPEPRLHQTLTFRYADRYLDLTLWGLGYILLSAIMGFALIVGRRTVYLGALSAAMLWMLGWTALSFLGAVHFSGSFSACLWPAFVTIACWASMRSLSSQELT